MLALNNWALIADEAVKCKNACVFTSVDRKKATHKVAFFVVKSVPEPVEGPDFTIRSIFKIGPFDRLRDRFICTVY